MALGTSQSNRPRLAAIPQALPTTQPTWLQFWNALQSWRKALTSPKWIAPTLGTNISYYGSPWNPPGYYIDAAGWVHLRGLVIGSGLAASATIFTLPSGLAPPYNNSFGMPGQNGSGTDGIWRVNVNQNGSVQIDATPPSGTTGNPTTYLFLDGISFSTTP